jgi:5-methylthioribose kinase
VSEHRGGGAPSWPVRLELGALTAEELGRYLRERGLIEAGGKLEVRPLGHGVSSVVLLVRATDRTLVLKQARRRLGVPAQWLADPARTVTEGEALRLAHELTPSRVPEVYDIDRANQVLALQPAPAGAVPWRASLLAGEVDQGVAAAIGAFVGSLHRHTQAGPAVQRFDLWNRFEELRVVPYFVAAGRARPDLSHLLTRYVTELSVRRACVVHADVSPKNVLLGHGTLWLVDFECCHLGDPAFDVAFMLSHLVMKTLHRPACSDAYAAAAAAFWLAYEDSARRLLADRVPFVVGLAGCLLVGRALGHSRPSYLTDAECGQMVVLGASWMHDPPDRLDLALDSLRRSAGAGAARR